MTQSSIREYVEAVRQRYFLTSKKEKGKILDEFTKVTGRHWKAAIRLIQHSALVLPPVIGPPFKLVLPI